MKCEGCVFPPAWKVYAAYDVDETVMLTHQKVARYPRPMALVCHAHLIPFLIRDKRSTSTTEQWIIKPIERIVDGR